VQGIKRARRQLLALLLWGCAILPGLPGCAGREPFEAPTTYASRLAAQGGMGPIEFRTPTFPVLGYRRAGRPGQGDRLRVYLEGDGNSFKAGRLTEDPTPDRALGLELAVADDTPHPVLYLARPCQFGLKGGAGLPCLPRYWDEKRFGREILDAVSSAVDQAKSWAGADAVEIVGYSGGGVVAALLAAERADVSRLVTVVAPLDTLAWTRDRSDDPLDEQQNPAGRAARLAGVPQAHVHGADDPIVRPVVAASYRRALELAADGRPRVWAFQIEASAGHACCWTAAWPRLRRSLGLD